MDLIPQLKRLKELSLKENKDITEMWMRELIYYFILLNRQQVPQVITAKINDQELFIKHVYICKNYFKCFIFDEQTNQ